MSKNKQKNKQQQREFRSDPPIRSTLGTMKVTLETLLATKDLVATVCDFGILIPEKPPQPPVVEEKVRSMSQGRAGVQQMPSLAWASIHPSIHPTVLFSPKWG